VECVNILEEVSRERFGFLKVFATMPLEGLPKLRADPTKLLQLELLPSSESAKDIQSLVAQLLSPENG
jgi:hypothetical protein